MTEEEEDTRAWDEEDKEVNKEEVKAAKNGKAEENAILISDTEDKEYSEQREYYEEGTMWVVKRNNMEKKEDKPEDGDTTEEEIEVEMTDWSSDEEYDEHYEMEMEETGKWQ